MLDKLSRSLDYAENLSAAIGGLLLVGGMLSVVLEVLSSYFFNYSLLWVHEVSEYILLYIPFLGAAWLLRTNGHIKVDILEQFLSKRIQNIMDVFIALVGMLVSGILVWYGFINTLDNYTRSINSLTVLEIPQVYVVMIIPIGSVLLLMEFMRKLYQSILAAKVSSSHRMDRSFEG